MSSWLVVAIGSLGGAVVGSFVWLLARRMDSELPRDAVVAFVVIGAIVGAILGVFFGMGVLRGVVSVIGLTICAFAYASNKWAGRSVAALIVAVAIVFSIGPQPFSPAPRSAYNSGWDWVASVPAAEGIQLFGPPGTCLDIYKTNGGFYSGRNTVEGYSPRLNEKKWTAGCRSAVEALRQAETTVTIQQR